MESSGAVLMSKCNVAYCHNDHIKPNSFVYVDFPFGQSAFTGWRLSHLKISMYDSYLHSSLGVC